MIQTKRNISSKLAESRCEQRQICFNGDVKNCDALKRISTRTKFDKERVKELLDDYIHVIIEHDMEDVNHILDACDCGLSENRDKQRKQNREIVLKREYVKRLSSEVHCYLYHNLNINGRDEIVRKIWGRRTKYNDMLENPQNQFNDNISYELDPSFIINY